MSNGMNLQQLIQAVYTETNRADLEAQTLQAIFASTLKMHGLDFFDKDIKTFQAVFDVAGYIQFLDTTTMPGHRRMAYLRKDDPTIYNPYETGGGLLPPLPLSSSGIILSQNQARAIIDFIDPDEILDDYGVERTDVAIIAGTTIAIKSSTLLRYANVGWYAWPDCDIGNGGNLYHSWIAQEYPFAIVYDAASSILQKIGMTDAARKYDAVPDPRSNAGGGGLVYSQIDMLLKSNIDHTGR